MHVSGRTVACAFMFLVANAHAQMPRTFRWSFTQSSTSGSLEECQTLTVALESLEGTASSEPLGTPPYSMLAFEPGGIPTTSALGSDPAHLSWQVKHARGSQVMLAVVDSAGDSGGVSDILYNVTAGSDLSCLHAPSASAVLQTNVSDTLETCKPWDLKIIGGVQPYTVVLSQLHSPTLTVVTLQENDDIFTYINRADPGWWMMASMFDATGTWGLSTALVQSTGSADTSCPGLESSETASSSGLSDRSFPASALPLPPDTSTSDATSGPNASTSSSAVPSTASVENRSVAGASANSQLAVGLALGIGIPVIAALVATFWFCTHRGKKQEEPSRSPIDMLASPVKSSRYSMRDALVTAPSDLRLWLLGHARAPSESMDYDAELSSTRYSDLNENQMSERRRSRLFSPWERLDPVSEFHESAPPSRSQTPNNFAAGHDLYSTVLVDMPSTARTPSPAATAAHEQVRRVAQVYLRPSSSRGSLPRLVQDPVLHDIIPRTASPDSIDSRCSRDGLVETEESHQSTLR